jgi:hypothetical protein
MSNLVIWLLRPLAIPTEMILHVGVGERYLGFINGALALLVMFTWGAVWRGDDAGLLVLWIFAFIGRVFIFMIACNNRKEYGGPRRHTYSPGRPLFGWRPGNKKPEALRGREGMLVLGLAFLCQFVDPTFAGYLFCSGGAMLVILGLERSIIRHRMLDRLDAEIERENETMALSEWKSREEPEEAPCRVRVETLPAPVPAAQFEVIEYIGANSPNIESPSQIWKTLPAPSTYVLPLREAMADEK